MDPLTICTLAECGEIEQGQFLSLMKRCSNDVVRGIFETIDDATLEAFLVRSDNFEPLLDLAIAALGTDSLRNRVKQWLAKAALARAKSEVVRCSRILHSIASHTSNAPPNLKQPSNSICASDGPAAPTGPPEVFNAAQAAAAPVSSVGPKPKQLPTLDPRSEQQSPGPKSLSPSPASPPSAPTRTDLPRTTGPFPLEAPSSPSVPQRPITFLPKSPPRIYRPPAPSSVAPKTASTSLPESPISPKHHPLRSNPKSAHHNVPASSSQPASRTSEGSDQIALSHPRVSPATPPAVRVRPVWDPVGPIEVEGALQPFPGNAAGTPKSQDSGNQDVVPHGMALPTQDPVNDLEPNEFVAATEEVEHDSSVEEPESEERAAPLSSGNPWDAATNAEKVKKWDLEGAIHGNPHHTSPVRTQWMHDDRKKATGTDDSEYKLLTEQEYSKFLKVPAALRAHAGLVFHKKSKFDWEVRVVLGRLAWDYSQIDEPENAKFLRDSLDEIEARFPDLSPAHMFRQIDKNGKKAVQKWWSDVAKWVQTAAGKMGGSQNDLNHHVEMLDSKKSTKKYDVYKILGLKRADVNYVAWGQTKEGTEKCEELINKEMEKWKLDPKNQALIELDGRVVGQQRLQVEGRIRRKQFDTLTKEEKELYSSKNKSGVSLNTDEDVQGVAECILSHLNLVCVQGANLGGLHIVLMASGAVSGGRLPVVIREYGVKPDPGPFLDKHDVGGRVGAEYPAYIASRFKGTAPTHPSSNSLIKALMTISRRQQVVQAGVGPLVTSNKLASRSFALWSPPANVNTDKKRAEYLSRFLGSTFKNNFSIQLSWNSISANNDRFIEPQRRPRDSHDRPVQLMSPLAMPVDSHLNPWWNFLQNCAKGQVANDEVFSWKPETTRLAIPSIPAPVNPNVHESGELSRTANVKKRRKGEANTAPRKSRKGKGNARPTSDDPELDLGEDVEGLMEDAEAYKQREEVTPTRTLRPRKTTNVTPARPSKNRNGSSVESESEDLESEQETNSRVEKSGQAGTSVTRSRPKPLRILSHEPQDVVESTQVDVSSPSAIPLLHNDLPAAPERDSRCATFPEDQPPAEVSQVGPCGPQPPSVEASEISPGTRTLEGPQGASTVAPTCSSPDDPSQKDSGNKVTFEPSPEEASSDRTWTDSARDQPAPEASRDATLTTSPGAAGYQAPVDDAPAKSPLKPSGKPTAAIKSLLGAVSGKRTQLPIRSRPFTELRLGHPRMFTGEASALGSPGWLQVKPLLSIWGSKVSFLNLSECDISYNPASPELDLPLPSALTSAISIMQVFLAMQQGDPHRPDVPLVRVSPTCGLDALHPHHHLRQVVEGILDVQAPLPSCKFFESNMLLKPEGIQAFFGVLEAALESFIDALTADDVTIRYAEIDFFTVLRLALYVKESTFMRDGAARGPATDRVASLLDRFVSVLASIAALRYMQEYLGEAAARWCREEPEKRGVRWEMWFLVGQLWKAAMIGLASAVSQKRQDLFLFRGIDDVIAPSVKSVIEHLIAQPTWWSPPGNGVPVAFTVGVKQFIPSETLFNRLPEISWARLSFLDRCSVLLTIFICAIQLSQEPDDSAQLEISTGDGSESLVQLFSMRCSDLKRVIEGAAGTELGPKKAAQESEDEVRRRRMVQAWVTVWASERGPHAEDTSTPAAASSDEEAVTNGQLPVQSQTSSVVPATPSVVDEQVGERGLENAHGLVPIAEEKEDESAELLDGKEESEIPTVVVGLKGGKAKRKVPVGGRWTAPPSVGAAENSRRRLRQAEASIEEEQSEERPRRTAYLNNVYSSRTCPPKAPTSKQPKAAVTKAKALAKSSEPSSSPLKLTKKQKAAEAAARKAAKKAA
ncbi:hypothetical protein M407DRAFT_23184 [Tulasnella calospora MUT 4182]|uniref:Uncharacterized protein n=1 Tax=Tulasnella calospora MUT 4182 TaxID=1051891 RepID=A0A0C3QLQ9_9AGAM|nr:hypothetical protein M407DRAFT_23184 [Tulasnella calospora MUT 4182]